MSKKTIQERFWSKVNVTDLLNCWEWTACNRDGYGMFLFNGKMISTNRVVWILYYGNIPEDMSILHKCDNRLCCNPSHLFIGTAKENSNDMVRKNRQYRPIGITNHFAKLTNEQVIEIRRLRELGSNVTTIAKLFGVSNATVSLAYRRHTWVHI